MNQLSVVVITLNEEENLPHLLEDLERQTAKNFEVIVVDSASTDNTVAIARSFKDRLPELNVIEMKRRGTSLGRNTGANAAQYERILFLDSDSRLSEDFLENSMSELEARGIDVGGVYMKSPGAPRFIALGVSLFNLGFTVMQKIFPVAVGGCIFSTRKVHNLLGGFNESITLCEDCDYVLRTSHQKGLKFAMLKQYFYFNPRRLEQEGFFSTGWTYIRANLRRLFIGELYGNPYNYQFGHYKQTGE